MTKKDTSIIDFVLGIILLAVGLVSIFKNTSVGSNWYMGRTLFGIPVGIMTLPLIIGIVVVIFNHQSKIGWLLVAIGMVLVLLAIVSSLRIIFKTTSLGKYLVMFICTFVGGALLAKAFFSFK